MSAVDFRGICWALVLVFLMGCEPPAETAQDSEEPEINLGSSFLKVGKADGVPVIEVPEGFPQEQDLAIMLPMDVEPPMRAHLETYSGEALLSQEWLNQVSRAYEPTLVEDALELENFYEDWQVVSVRIATCGPLGTYPGQLPLGVCWPQVRIVWQPVLSDFFLDWASIWVERYAEDRAIHALYRVHPEASEQGIHPALAAVQEQLATEEGFDGVTQEMMWEFYHARDRSILRLVESVKQLRADRALGEEWSKIDWRAEYALGEEEMKDDFHQALYRFLAAYAEPQSLHELTSFSLPEGRVPALIDIWVFLAFDGHQGELTQRDITVLSREDGSELVNLGLDQTVATLGEDPDLEFDLERDPTLAERLDGQVFLSAQDEERFPDVIADPQQTFVQNTTCATCHRLTDIGFDFHTFSYFEERILPTISPRVVKDVEFDLLLMRSFIANINSDD